MLVNNMNITQPFVIREARVDDAPPLVAYMHRLTGEPHNNILLDPGQWTMTEEQEREFLSKRVGRVEGRHPSVLVKQGVLIDDLTMGLILKRNFILAGPIAQREND
jgi:hypothetical protein